MPKKSKSEKKKKKATDVLKAVASGAIKISQDPTVKVLAKAVDKMMNQMPQYAMAKQAMGALGKLPVFRGHGDYMTNFEDVRTNALIKGPVVAKESFGTRVPHRVRNREFVKNITSVGGGGFSVDRILIQPGLAEPFPLLSALASCFTRFKVNGIIYEFVPLVSDYTTTGQMGAIIMCYDLNVGSPQPGNKTAAENLAGAVSSKPSHGIMMGVECEHQNYNGYLIRVADTNFVQGTVEDYAQAFICQSGLNSTAYPAGTVVGELWVTYDISFYDMRLPYLTQGFWNSGGSLSNTSAAANPFPTSAGINRTGIFTNVSVSGTTISLRDVPIGSQIGVIVVWTHAAGVATLPTLTPIGCSFANGNFYSAGNQFTSGWSASASGTTSVIEACLYIDAEGATLACTGLAFPSGNFNCSLQLVSYGQSLSVSYVSNL